MFREPLERWLTLDFLFGPYQDAELEAARRDRELTELIDREVDAVFRPVYAQVSRQWESERESWPQDRDKSGRYPWPSCLTAAAILIDAFARAEDRCRRIAHLKAQRHNPCGGLFWKAFVIEDQGVDVAIRAGLLWEGEWSIRMHLFPPLRIWLSDLLWSLEDSIRSGEEAICRIFDGLRKTTGRLAHAFRLPIDRFLSVIEDALTEDRHQFPAAIETTSILATPPDPTDAFPLSRVLAAGTNSGSFITRC